MRSRGTTIAVAGSLIALAGLGYSFLGTHKKSTDLVEIDEDDCITADECVQFFDRIFLEMQHVLAQLMQQIQQIQMAGQQIPERQLKALLRGEMERALKVKQQILLDEYDMDYDCLEEATWEFVEKEEARVVKAVERFQKLWENATGDAVVGWRPGKTVEVEAFEILSPSRLIEVAEKYFDALTESMRRLVDEFKAEGKNLQDPAVQQQLNMEFAQNANDAGEAALEVEGVSMKQFEDSVKSHQNDPNVGRALGMLQMKQQQELMSMGQG